MNHARALHSATFLADGRVLVAGGAHGGVALKSAEIYDPSTQSWSATANDMALARYGHVAVLLANGKLLVSGGSTGGGNAAILPQAEIYDPATNRWSLAAAMQSARSGHIAAMLVAGPYAGKVLVAGGDNGNGAIASAELYDPDTNSWSRFTPMAVARENHSAVVLPGGRVLVIGGGNGAGSQYSSEIFDPVSGAWQMAAIMANARENHTATLLSNGKVLVSGGHSGVTAIAGAELYDPVSDRWTQAASLIGAREKHAAVRLADGRVIVAGGHDGSGALASGEIYDPVANSWSALAPMSAARENFTATGLGSALVLATGGDDGTATGYLQSAELFSILLTQTITFNALADQKQGSAPVALGASASSGLPVTYATAGPCTVRNRALTLSGVGVCRITAMQAGNATYAPAPSVQRSFSIVSTTSSSSGPNGTASQTNRVSAPQRAGEAASVPSIGLTYFTRARDRVGKGDLSFAPDVELDLVFTATLNTGSGTRTVTRLELTDSAGNGWNTVAADNAWFLGVATGLDTPFLNATNGAVNFTMTEGSRVNLFAADRGIPTNGTVFTLVATFSDGTAASATTTVSGAVALEFGFTKETVATLDPYSPVGLAFAPDGRLFVWQKEGIVRIVKNGALLPTPFLDFRNQVNSCGDRGMLGLAIDPNFAVNRYIYLLYVHEPAGDPSDCNSKFSRLTRVTADAVNSDVVIPGSEVIILDGIEVNIPSHSVGTLRFAPDGKLFVSHGDGANHVDVLALRAQDLNTYNGKVLRINPDGSAPSDNPFYDGTNSIRSKVWAYGMRNPYRLALHPLTGEPYIGDVGLSLWEEINRGRGANFGWPCYEGPAPQPAYQAVFEQCRQLPASAITQPLYTYGRLSGSTIIGGAFYTGSLYPAQYLNNFFIADYTFKWVARMVFDANDNLVGVYDFATNVDGPVSIEMGPDGMLYYVALNSGEIGRFRYAGNQQPPIAVASAVPAAGYSPLTVNFTGSNSFDPKGGQLGFLWDFGDGTTSTLANPQHTYSSAGIVNFIARLTVTDSTGQTASASQTVTVGNLPPVPTIGSPANGTLVVPGQTVTFQGSATDPDQGTLPPSALSWTVLLHHNEHVHPYITASGESGSFLVPDHGEGNFRFEVILTATDGNGLRSSATILLPMPSVGTPDVVAAYSFNEGFGTTLYDTSGNNHHGAITNGTWTTQAHFNKALDLDGSSSFITVADSPLLSLVNAGTLEGWVRLGALNRFHGVIAKGGDNSASAHQYALQITDVNRLRCSLGDGVNSQQIESVGTLTAGQFRHVACTWNGTTLALYLDGALDTSMAKTVTPAANTAPLFLGQYGGNVNRLFGTLDEVRIYNRALSQIEIQFDLNSPIVSTTNIAPTITTIPDRTTSINTAVGPLGFTIGDLETPAANLTVSAVSSDQTVLPNGNIALAGSGSNRTLSLTPATNQTGTATITLTVSDGLATASTSFQLTVNPPPSISVTPNVAAVGTSVTVSWSNIPTPTGTDWIALYTIGSGNTSYRDWVYVNCSKVVGAPFASGSCNFPLLASLPTGTYEFRLLINDTFNSLAVSNPLTVAGPLPVVSVAATVNSIAENGSTNGLFTISRATAGSTALTVSYATSGSATAGSDYQALSGSMTIPAGQTAATVTVVPIDDTLLEGSETVILTLSPTANYTVGSPASATLTIVDDEAAAQPTVSVTATANAAEPATHGQFTLSRSGSTAGALTVNFIVSGSATAGTDYASIGSSATIPAGAASVTLPVTVIDDAIYEGPETVILTLTANINYNIGASATATVTIADNETPPAGTTLTVAPTAVVQGDVLTVTWSNIASPSAQDWMGLYAIGAPVTSFLTWFYVSCGQGATAPAVSGSCFIGVPLGLANGSYEFRLMRNDTYTVITTSNTIAVGIPSVNIAATANAAEPGTPGQFTVSRTGSTANPLVVNFAVTGSATPGTDYNNIGVTVVIPVGSPSATIPITVIDDTLYEGNETVTITLVANAAYVIGSSGSATVTIADDDKPIVTVVASDATASETGSDTGTFTVSRNGITTAPLTVQYSLGGTATNGIDYQTLPGSITIPAGQSSASITVVPIDDGLYEGTEGVALTLIANAAYVLGSPSVALINITDDDKPVVTIAATDAAAAEAGLDTGTITVSRDGITTAPLTVNYTVSGTASPGIDYQGLTGSVTIPPGQSGATITVTPIDDSLFEGPETVVVTLSANAAYVIGTAATATVTISDDDKPVVTIVANDANASESGPDTGAFTISRDGLTTAPLTVNYSIGGTATNGLDYQNLSSSITISAGQSSVALLVTPIDDSEFEGSETVMVTLSSNANYTLGSPSSATVTIADDDSAPLPIVTIAATVNNAAEPSTNGQFTVTRSGSTANSLTVNFAVSGSATPGSDYTNIGTSVVIPTGSSSQTISVNVIDDSVVEASETVIVTLSSNANYALGSPSSATVTIADNDGPSITASPTTVAAGGSVTVTWSGIINPSATDWFALYAQGANNNAYLSWLYVSCFQAPVAPRSAGSCSLTVPANLTNGTYELRLLANNGFSTIAVSNPITIGVAVTLPVVTITATTNAAEPSTNGQFTVSRTGSTGSSLAVNFAVSGTATPGSDYADIGTGVVIPVGAASATIAVNVIDDGVVEGSETVIVTLSSSGNYTVGSPSSATVTIADDDVVVLPVVTITATANAAEPSTNGQFTVSRSGSTANSLTVNFTVGGSATAGSDYTSIGTSVVIPAGSSAQTIAVSVIDDNVFEGSETVVVTLIGSANHTVGSPSSATVTIVDNDTAPVGPVLVATPGAVTQGGVVAASWSGIVNPSPTDWLGLYPQGANNGSYSTWMYVSCLQGAGAARPSGSCDVTVPTNLASGSYELRLLANNGFSTIAVSNPITVGSAVVLPMVSIQATANAAEPSTNGQFTVTRTGSTGSSLTVNLAVTGSATPGSDYGNIATSVVIAAGATSANIAVNVIDDSVIEGSETVILTLSGSANYTVGSPSSAIVTIADDETPPAGPFIGANPTTVSGGITTTVSWSGVANPSPNDWIGLYPIGAGNGSYLSWIYVSCSQGAGLARASGSCGFFIPGGLAPGSYQFRLLANDGFNTIAASSAVTVQ